MHDRYQHYPTKYLKQLEQIAHAMSVKASSIDLRNKILRRQKAKNYQMEMDRVGGYLSRSLLSQVTPNKRRLMTRQAELTALGALAFDRRINDED